MAESESVGGTGRRLVVSNRLPFEVKKEKTTGEPRLVKSAGGLVRALDAVLRRSATRGLWFGWSGEAGADDEVTDAAIAAATRDLPYDVVPVALEPDVVAGYYDGFANRTLWPLFHDLLGRATFDESYWRAYVAANERFAAAVAIRLAPDDVVWAHDFHLLAFARALRERRGTARVGLFLHVPFPPQGLFHRLPWRREIAEALLGYDTIGFQTARDLRAFGRTVRELLVDARPLDTADREVAFERAGRVTRAGVFPIGIDFAEWDALGRDAGVVRHSARFRHGNGELKIVLGVDRLDYSKGIAPRLRAFADLLERRPEWRERVHLVQIAVPSRTSVKDYRELKKEIDGLIGLINGKHATPSWVPVNYINRSFSERDLAAYYRAADVALVTPIKDGMNLVAKEFCAASVAGRGVLVLSEFAGAAAELASGALLVNPHDVTGVADALHRALEMPVEEQASRLEDLRATIAAADVYRWAEGFLAELESGLAPLREPKAVVDEWAGAGAEKILLVLDYDGTLVPIRPVPGMAAPTPETVRLLSEVAAAPGVTLVLSSGRSLSELDAWFPDPRVVLVAGHGAAWRRSGEVDLLLARSWSAVALDAARERVGSPGTELEFAL